MEKEPNEILEELTEGMAELRDECPELVAAFVHMDSAAYIEGELDRKVKELIGLGIALAVRCEYCINTHVKQALEAGANREEILEAAAVSVAFGGSPSMAYVSTRIMKALDAFE